MNSGAFSKPCEYVGSVHWKWEEDIIVGLEIETSAYALAEQKPDEFCNLTDIPVISSAARSSIATPTSNGSRKRSPGCLAKLASPVPPFEYEQAALSEIGPYILAHYISDYDEYVVIVSPELDPQEFCKPGYEVAHTLEIWKAGDFPADVILRPDHEYQEAEIEPDEGPLVEQYENASRLGDDGWLEAAMEDSISGWDE